MKQAILEGAVGRLSGSVEDLAIHVEISAAVGKVLLAAPPPRQLDDYILARDLPASTPSTSDDRLRTEIENVRLRGFAIDDAEFHEELRCIAVPVRDFTGRVIAAIGISVPVWKLTVQDLRGFDEPLTEVGRALSTELGYREAESEVSESA